MEIRPVDLEALGQEKKRWDLSNIVSVLSDLISRQRGDCSRSKGRQISKARGISEYQAYFPGFFMDLIFLQD